MKYIELEIDFRSAQAGRHKRGGKRYKWWLAERDTVS